jgi:hypothetical protein
LITTHCTGLKLKELNCKNETAVINRGLISNNKWDANHESQCGRKMKGNNPVLLSDTIPEFFSKGFGNQ